MCEPNTVIGNLIGCHCIWHGYNKSENWLKRAFKAEPEMDRKAKMVTELVKCPDGTIECPLDSNEINMLLTHLCIE